MLYCVLTRSEINLLKTIVHEADPDAFMVIGAAPMKRWVKVSTSKRD